jgi:predicted RNA binding protein YcfA (HicA-like mRNA interferase family)
MLCKNFGFQKISQKGSHIKLKNSEKVTIVPNHKEIAYGTFKSVLNLAGISEREFYEKM